MGRRRRGSVVLSLVVRRFVVRRVVLVVPLVVAALALAGCSGGGTGSTSSPPTTAAGTATTVAGQAGCTPFHGVITSLTSSGKVSPGFLVDAQADQVDCLDRVTFFFDAPGGLAPGYTVQYQDVSQTPLTDCAGPISLPGSAFLVVVLKPASSTNPFAPEGEQDTYKGNLRLSYGPMNHLQIVQKLCDGDGTVTWVIGLDSVRPFVVDRAIDPVRVSVLIG